MAIRHARGLAVRVVRISAGAQLVLALIGAPTAAAAVMSPELQFSEASGESVQIKLSGDWTDCGNAQEPLFDASVGIAKVSQALYSQRLNSEVGDGAVYLKAARMGGGVYVHLPYFFPVAKCEGLTFVVNAQRILWGGKWYPGSIRIPAAMARDKSIFFTNEMAPHIYDGAYFDANIPGQTRVRLESAFARIVTYYHDSLLANPMNGIGVVAAIVRNDGNYSGWGGDSLNIIRMSYDNPTEQELDSIGTKFPATFAHELAHKLQSERLFQNPFGRTIAEGSADFLKVLVLSNAGLIDEDQGRQLVMKALADCARHRDDTVTYRERNEQRKISFREPYDCGMAYYFVAYYSSGRSASAFIDALKAALAGNGYVDETSTMCLLFEPGCKNQRLRGIIGNRSEFLAQSEWLGFQMRSRPLPELVDSRVLPQQ